MSIRSPIGSPWGVSHARRFGFVAVAAVTGALGSHSESARANPSDPLFPELVQPGGLNRLGDFDGDGVLDRLAWKQDTATFYRGLGNGRFAPATSTNVALFTGLIQFVTDLNDDGKDDLVSYGLASMQARILYGGPLGAGATGTSNLLAASGKFVTAGDFSGDGKSDLLEVTDSSVILYTGNGLGQFMAQTPQQLNLFLGDSFGVGDLDGDGDLDFVSTSALTVQILRNQGTGTFAAIDFVPANVFGGLTVLAVANFDGDLAEEVLLRTSQSPTYFLLVDSITAAQGFGGTFPFSTATFAAGATNWTYFGNGDFTHDGKHDLVLGVAFGQKFELSILAAAATPTGFLLSTQYKIPSAVAMTVANLDGDTDPDLIEPIHLDQIVVHLDAAKPAAGLLHPGTPGSFFDPVAAADFDLDGDVDVVNEKFAVGYGLQRNAGNGDLVTFEPLPVQGPGIYTVEDATTLGPDLLILSSANTLVLLRNDGTGSFTLAPQDSSAVNPVAEIATGDVNHDGRPDAVYSTGTAIASALGSPSGIAPASILPSVAGSPRAVALGDVTGDGHLDIVSAEFVNLSAPSVCAVYAGDGAGNFAFAFSAQSLEQPSSLVVADFDRDGFADAAVASSDVDAIVVLLANGTSFRTPQTIATPISSLGSPRLIAGELTGDAWCDLVLSDESSTTTQLFFGSSTGVFTVGTAHHLVGRHATIADFDGDGRNDLLCEASLQQITTLAFANPSALCAATYGTGKAGSLGIPALLSLGPTALGAASGLRIEHGLPGALPVMFLGSAAANTPFDQGTLLVQLPASALPLLPFPGTGTLDLLLTLPSDPALCGIDVFFQSLHVDSAAAGPNHTAQSNGLRWTLGI